MFDDTVWLAAWTKSLCHAKHCSALGVLCSVRTAAFSPGFKSAVSHSKEVASGILWLLPAAHHKIAWVVHTSILKKPKTKVDLVPGTQHMIRLTVLQWQALEQMHAASIRPDTACYAAVIDLLWCSGIVGAQERAQQLFHLVCRQSVRNMEAVQAVVQGGDDTLEVTFT